MRYAVVDRQCSVLIFKDHSEINYVSSCQIFTYGDVGIMYGINGHQFYELMSKQGLDVMNEIGVTTLQGYVTAKHARLMRMALRDIATVTEAHRGMMAGHEMIWMIIKAKVAGISLEEERREEERRTAARRLL